MSHPRPQQCVIVSLSIFSMLFLQIVSPVVGHAQEGADVVAGSATISQQGNVTNINSQSQRTIINWNKFDVPGGTITNFNQPGSNSAVLNRVVTQGNPSLIYGTLNSNGNVLLINPSGILVGPTGVINTNGFTASVLDVLDQDFLNGDPLHFRGDSTASVINQGKIYTGAGGATLIGGSVINEGLISSQGKINLITGGSVKLDADGTYTQADAATVQNGISETAGLIKNSGEIRATGAMEIGGEVYLVAPGSKVMQEAIVAARKMDAGGNTVGGKVVVDTSGGPQSTGETNISGSIDVSGDLGGEVSIAGDSVALKGADINASGLNGGGTINIGGGFQGSDDSIANSLSTLVDENSTLAADAWTSGDGGTVIVWSDGVTDYRGLITATGGPLGSGGFVEISGKQLLNFCGLVETGGGDLLLDPFNYTIDATAAGNIVTALGSNNVTVQTTVDNASQGSTGAGDGDISVDSDITWSTANALTLLAQGGIILNAGVQNDNATGGDLNMVAGWNGTTAFDAATFLAQDITTTTVFGNSGGSVFIGSASAAAGVAVGSANGQTNVFGHDVTLRGSDSEIAYAQLGFHHVGGGAANDTITTGNINVLATGGVTAEAGRQGDFFGSSFSSFVQLGHGGDRGQSIDSTAWNYTGDITLEVQEDISFTAGGGDGSYAQLGNGGYGADGNHSGSHTITRAHDITFTAGGVFAYAQLGNGGFGVDGNPSGNHTITQANDITFTGGSLGAYAQLGNGGGLASGRHSGNHTITQANDIIFTAGGGEDSYARLGNGGSRRDGNHSGNHTITQANDITFTGGSFDFSNAQLGNGGVRVDGDHSGNHTITQANDITFTGGGGSYAYAQLGNGGYEADGNHSGSHTITRANDISFSTRGGFRAYAQLGNGGSLSRGNHSGGHTIAQANDVAFLAGNADAAYAQLGNGGYRASGNQVGDHTISAANDILFQSGDGLAIYAQLGNGGHSAAGDHGGNHSLMNVHDITFQGGNGNGAYALLGNGGSVAIGSHSGNHTLALANNIAFRGGSGGGARTQLGNGGFRAYGNHTGDHTITQVNNIRFHAGQGSAAYAQLGNGGYAADGSHSGSHTLEMANNISFQGGGIQAYAQLGNGGFFSVGGYSGSHKIVAANDVTFQGGSGYASYTQLGNGGISTLGDQSGNHSISQVNDIAFLGGAGILSSVQFGNGGEGADGNQSGNHTMAMVNNIAFHASVQQAFAHFGNGGARADGNHTGSHTIMQANGILFQAGISQAYAQLGNGGRTSLGSHSGDHALAMASDIEFRGGSGIQAYAQLGNGGYQADGSHSGTIDVTTTGKLTLTGQNTVYNYALIGHGDEPGDSDSGDTVVGDISLRIDGSIDLTDAFIGHLIDRYGNYTSGNTFIGTENLTTDPESQFFSAPSGQLRLYVVNPNDNVDPAALLNGTPHGPDIFPNNQGPFPFGAGPYIPAPGTNFAYYTNRPTEIELPKTGFVNGAFVYDQFTRYQDYFFSVQKLLDLPGGYSTGFPGGIWFEQDDNDVPPGFIPASRTGSGYEFFETGGG